MAEVIILGTGPAAQVMRYYLAVDSPHRVVGFTTWGDEELPPGWLEGLPLLGIDDVRAALPPSSHRMLVAVEGGSLNAERQRAFEHARRLGYELVSYVSSRACVADGVRLGANCVILEAAVIQPFAEIGDDVTMEPGCHVGHESIVGSHSYLAARTVVSGNVTIGPRCRLGPNATVRNSVALAADTAVGPGASILKATESMHEYLAQETVLLPISSHDAWEGDGLT